MKQQPIADELINVHRVHGPKNLIVYLRLADPEMTEGLFFQAKRTGQIDFPYEGKKYTLKKNKDGSFSLHVAKEQTFSVEEFS